MPIHPFTSTERTVSLQRRFQHRQCLLLAGTPRPIFCVDPNATVATVGFAATEMRHRSNRHCGETAVVWPNLFLVI
jgi:hypothetical protein